MPEQYRTLPYPDLAVMPGFSRIKPGLPECAVLREKTHEKTVAAAAAASFAAVPSFAGDTAEDTCYGYFDGNNAEQHYPEALKYCREAAEQGKARAQYLLGYMLENGKGTAADRAGALEWYRKAADQGYATAEYVVGAFYFKGIEVEQDAAEAVRWFKKAAEHGQPDAPLNLFAIYAYGNGVKQDYAEAVKWVRMAADKGVPEAQTALGKMYLGGMGVSGNNEEGLKWFRKAAERGGRTGAVPAWSCVPERPGGEAGYCRGGEVDQQGRRAGVR